MEHYIFIAAGYTAGLHQKGFINERHQQRSLPVSLTFHSPLDNQIQMVVKRMFDLVLSSLLIVMLLSWLVPLMTLLIKWDSKGPVFFLQKRYKRNGRLFTCIKFRTMVENHEADMLAAKEHDHRITRIGTFLRKYHIDEFPQLFNVWIGDMSVIGPRPYMASDNHRFSQHVEQYELRYKVKPGITGLAQSLGYHGVLQNEHQIKERTVLDLLYIKQWSVLMDIQIIYRTFCMMTGVGKHAEPSLLNKTALKL